MREENEDSPVISLRDGRQKTETESSVQKVILIDFIGLLYRFRSILATKLISIIKIEI